MKKTRKNLLTKFRDFWRDLTPLEKERMWAIMTALRGSDSGYSEEKVKKATTARIRGLLFGKKILKKWSRMGYIRPTFRSSEKIEKKELNESLWHFRSHLRRGILALKPYIKKGKMDDLLKLIK